MIAAGLRARGLLGWLLLAGASAACAGPPSPAGPRAPARPKLSPEQERSNVADFVALEREQLDCLEAADPRVALRAGHPPPPGAIEKVGMMGVLAEDPDAAIRGQALDLFAFRARARILDHVGRAVKAFAEPLPETGAAAGALARPRLERDLLVRFVDEEIARTAAEARLGDASADLVRGMVSTWEPPATPQEWPERDAWAQKRLFQIRDSLRDPAAGLAPTSLDVALYPLERLLAPMQFPKGAAALAEVRMALDADMRVVPKVAAPERLARDAASYLGVELDTAGLPARLDRLRARLRSLSAAALEANGGERALVEARARDLLMVERPCPAVPDSPLRGMAPPPERAPICGALRAVAEEERPAAALVALHDDVLFSLSAVVSAPPPRTELLSHPPDDVVDALHRMARERPVLALGVALAAELIYPERAPAGPARSPEARIRAWRALGEAPLDVVARELDPAQGASDSGRGPESSKDASGQNGSYQPGAQPQP